MGRKKEVLNALDELGIGYRALESGEVLFKYGDGNFWFHPDDSHPEFVTLNRIEERSMVADDRHLCSVANEINKGAPGIKAVMLDGDVMLNCDLYSGRHRLNADDLNGALERLEMTGKILARFLNAK